MKTHFPIVATLIAAAALAGPVTGVHAQADGQAPVRAGTAASSPTAAASAPRGPRLRSPVETGNRAAAPGDLRPERPVAPQITIPLGRKPVPKRDGRSAPPPGAAPAGGVDDAAAHCESQADPQERARCKSRLVPPARAKAPG